jgi:AAA domain/Bifunctional DNA primase/polymerase, N-terminal
MSTTPMPSEDFLPVEESPHEARSKLLAHGYVPLPAAGKAVYLHGWSNVTVDQQAVDEWENRSDPNTSVRTSFTPMFDIDIRHEAAAKLVEDVVRGRLQQRGVILVRVGLPPKRAIVMRTLVPFKKKFCVLAEPDGKAAHKIEILGDGQQIVVAGIHPDTKAPYTWLGGRSPVNTLRAHVPSINESEAEEILALCVQKLKDELGWIESSAEVVTLVPDETPLPLNERLAATEYQGQHGLNEGILAMTATLISDGSPVKDAVEQCMQFVRGVWDKIPDEHPDKAGWNWNAQRDQIADACYGFIRKECENQPRIVDTLPDWMLKKWRDIEARGGTPFIRKRKHWGVEDKGPADEIPDVEAPPIAPSSEGPGARSKRNKPANVLVPFKAFDPADLPRRQWLLDQHYMRGVVSITAGMGGRGKSTNSLVEAVVLATARPLLGEPPGERCHVWYHCGDDSMEELHRRVAAICQRYSIDMEELESWLFLTTPREFELRVAEGYMDVKTDNATINRIHDQVEANAVDVAILDPLVKLHLVREADVGMDRVIGVFQSVADEHGCSVEIVHHTRKGVAGQVDAVQGGDDMRGSSAIQGAVRSQRMVNVMPAPEAARLQIFETDRRRYIRITNEKVNYAPSGRGSWFRLASVELPNGDNVGVVEPWKHPDEGGEITPEMVAAQARAEEVFLAILARFTAEGRFVSDAKKGNYAPRLFAEEQEAKGAGVSFAYLEGAMRRLLQSKRMWVGKAKDARGRTQSVLEVEGGF